MWISNISNTTKNRDLLPFCYNLMSSSHDDTMGTSMTYPPRVFFFVVFDELQLLQTPKWAGVSKEAESLKWGGRAGRHEKGVVHHQVMKRHRPLEGHDNRPSTAVTTTHSTTPSPPLPPNSRETHHQPPTWHHHHHPPQLPTGLYKPQFRV